MFGKSTQEVDSPYYRQGTIACSNFMPIYETMRYGFIQHKFDISGNR